MHGKIKLLLTIVCLISILAKAQDSSGLDRAISFPSKLFSALDRKAALAQSRLDKQTDRYLSKLQKRENRLRKKLAKKDSAVAKQLFNGVDEKYAALKNTTGNLNKYSSVYSQLLELLFK